MKKAIHRLLNLMYRIIFGYKSMPANNSEKSVQN